MSLHTEYIVHSGVGFGPEATAHDGFVSAPVVTKPTTPGGPYPVSPAASSTGGRSAGGGGGGGFFWYAPPTSASDPIWDPPSDLKVQPITDDVLEPGGDQLPPALRPYFEQDSKAERSIGNDEGVPGPWDLIARGIGDATRKQVADQGRKALQAKREQLEQQFAERVAQIEAEHRAFVAQLQAKERDLDEAARRFELLANQHIAWKRHQHQVLQERQRHAWEAQQQYERATQQASLAIAHAEQQARAALAAADAGAIETRAATDLALAQANTANLKAMWMLIGGAALGLLGLWFLLRPED